MNQLEDWKVDGKNLKKRFEFKNFAEALDFVNKVGAIAEETRSSSRHFCSVGVTPNFQSRHTTRGGLTHNDFELAEAIENL